jgi:hypothetical protein
LKISASGELLGEYRWKDAEESAPAACDARQSADGDFLVYGYSEQAVHVLQLHNDQVESARSYQLREPLGEGRITWVAACSDGGCIATGEVLNPDGNFKDLLLLRLTPSGQIAWLHMFGGRRKESGNHVLQTDSGHFVAVGVTASSENRDQEAYVVHTDVSGRLLWDTSFGGSGDQAAIHVSSVSDSDFLVVGQSSSAEGAPTQLHFARIGSEGAVKAERWIGRENARYSGVSAAIDDEDTCWVLGTRAIGEFWQDMVLLRLEGAAGSLLDTQVHTQ